VNQFTGITNVGFNSNWYGTAHVFPNEGCPAWALEQNTVPVMPVFTGDSLRLNALSADQYMDYSQSGSLVAPGDTFVCEFRMRFVSGNYGDPGQRAAGVFVRFSNNNYAKLMIGKDEFFIWNANNSKGTSVFAETDDLFHTYRIEVMNKTSIRVFYDGNLALTGATVFGSSGEKEITFGKLSGNSFGQSKWLWFRHNASTESNNSQIALLQPVNQAVDIVLNPTLSWLASGCVTSYHLQFSDNSSFDPLIFNDSLLTTTSKQISGLVKGTTYYWRVRGTGYGNTNPWSETWHFRTHTDTLIVTTSKTISMDTTFAYVKVTPTGILIANIVFHVTGDLLVQPGGTITHDSRNMAGLRLNVDDSLVVEPGGNLNTDGKGLLGGPGGSVRTGESYDLATGNIIRITPEAAGGCHGGLGGGNQPPSYVYGNEMNPEFFGSGSGGGAASSGQSGGNGGGKIFINAGSLILHGNISANGQNGSANPGNPGGGGGGGTVWINAGTVSGTGTITANGGISGYVSGSVGGGGGRIGLIYGLNNFAGILKAKGGAKTGYGHSAGSAGTIFTKSISESAGALILDNDHIEPGNSGVTLISTPGARTYKTAQVKNRGALTVTSGISLLTCQNQFLAENLSKITINANASIAANPFQLNGSNLYIPAGYQVTHKMMVSAGTIQCADTLRLLNDTLSGTANIYGSLRNQGVLIPGNPTGTISVYGKYEQKSSGALVIDIGGKNPGVNFDLLSISSQANLSGTLKINLVNNFQPATGDSFSFINCGSRTGQFATVVGWDNYKVLYRYNRVTLLRIENINHPPVAKAGPDRGYTAALPVVRDGSALMILIQIRSHFTGHPLRELHFLTVQPQNPHLFHRLPSQFRFLLSFYG
jgi:hypothetical protein